MIKGLYGISIYTENLCVQLKIMIRTKWTYLFSPSLVFLIAGKVPSLVRLWNFQNFSLFCEKLRVIEWVDYFVLKIYWRWVEKNIFLILWILTPLNQNEKKYFTINVKTKVFL